jgi:hypothetical protein
LLENPKKRDELRFRQERDLRGKPKNAGMFWPRWGLCGFANDQAGLKGNFMPAKAL